MPVDLYVGGAEHSVLHLLYARFWHKVLYDIGVVSTKEPFQKLVHQGIILGETEYTLYKDSKGNPVSAELVHTDGTHLETGEPLTAHKLSEDEIEKRGDYFVLKGHPEIRIEARAYKMSKSRGNVVNPDYVVNNYGADSLRLYEMFMGPLKDMKSWSMKGVEGVHRFLNRVWRLVIDEESDTLHPLVSDEAPDRDQLRLLHQTIKKVTQDIDEMAFNTAIAQMMIFVNEAYKWKTRPKSVLESFVLLLSPFAPHIAEELWQRLGHDQTLAYEPWPEYDEELIKENTVEIVLQINGKVRGTIQVSREEAGNREVLEKRALESETIQKRIAGKEIKKVIAVPNRLVNVVVK